MLRKIIKDKDETIFLLTVSDSILEPFIVVIESYHVTTELIRK
jgi:hypothetical protein